MKGVEGSGFFSSGKLYTAAACSSDKPSALACLNFSTKAFSACLISAVPTPILAKLLWKFGSLIAFIKKFILFCEPAGYSSAKKLIGSVPNCEGKPNGLLSVLNLVPEPRPVSKVPLSKPKIPVDNS